VRRYPKLSSSMFCFGDGGAVMAHEADLEYKVKETEMGKVVELVSWKSM